MSLADRIIENGPYVTGDVMPFPAAPNGHPLITAAEINELRDELIAARHVTTYEEWRVTGTLRGEPFEVTWSLLDTSAFTGGETEARKFIALIRENDGWTDGPHLDKRTVTVTDWQEAEA